MAENKKSVLLYCDIIHTVKELTNEEAGILFKHYLEYINDLNPEAPDRLTKIVFEPIKRTLKRDLVKYNQFIEKQRVNGLKGGRPKTQITQAFSGKPKKADKDKDKDKDKVIVNDINKRKADFMKSLSPFYEKYEVGLRNEFYDYWTEHNEKGKKMRFEYAKNQPFDISRRLATWLKNQKRFEKEKSSAKKESGLLIDKMKKDYGISN